MHRGRRIYNKMRAENPLCFEGLGATQLSGEGWQQWLQFPPKEHNPFQLLMFQLFGVTDTHVTHQRAIKSLLVDIKSTVLSGSEFQNKFSIFFFCFVLCLYFFYSVTVWYTLTYSVYVLPCIFCDFLTNRFKILMPSKRH